MQMANQNLSTHRRGSRELISPFDMLQNRIDRMFEDFSLGLPMRRPMEGASDLMPSLEMTEKDGKILVSAELPGVDEKDIEVSVDDDVLTIAGEKKSEIEDESSTGHRSERIYGSFSRSIQLPFAADPQKVDARFDKGVLKLTIERPENAQEKSRKIEIHH